MNSADTTVCNHAAAPVRCWTLGCVSSECSCFALPPHFLSSPRSHSPPTWLIPPSCHIRPCYSTPTRISTPSHSFTLFFVLFFSSFPEFSCFFYSLLFLVLPFLYFFSFVSPALSVYSRFLTPAFQLPKQVLTILLLHIHLLPLYHPPSSIPFLSLSSSLSPPVPV